VAHPQIAVFARLATENSQPVRLLSGQKTRLSRTMHDVRYDEVNDEFLVTNPFGQAVLVSYLERDGQLVALAVLD